MTINFFNRKNYTIIHSCSNCDKGYICKTKDNTPGFKESFEYLCTYCQKKSKIGDKVYYSEEFLDIPIEYRKGMRETSTPEEFSYFQSIWLTSHTGGLVAFDESNYRPLRDPLLFPMHEYLNEENIKKALDDEQFDMIEHNEYIKSPEGQQLFLSRIFNGDFGKCEYCGANLYPYGNYYKPFRRKYTLYCCCCSFEKGGESDSAYYFACIPKEIQEHIDIFGKNWNDQGNFITKNNSIDLFEKILLISKETETLDFKQNYSLNEKRTSLTQSAKKELRKDITAFANHKGGNIVIGGLENKDLGEIIYVGTNNFSIIDQELIDQITSDKKIEPPINDVNLHEVHRNGKFFLIINIPESKRKLHKFEGKIPIRHGIITKYL